MAAADTRAELTRKSSGRPQSAATEGGAVQRPSGPRRPGNRGPGPDEHLRSGSHRPGRHPRADPDHRVHPGPERRAGDVEGVHAYILGWFLSLVVVIAGTSTDHRRQAAPASTAPSDRGARRSRWRSGWYSSSLPSDHHRQSGRPRNHPHGWPELDQLSGWTAAGLGVLLQPWPLVVPGRGNGDRTACGLLRSPMPFWPDSVSSARPASWPWRSMPSSPRSSARKRLGGVRTWIDTHRDQAIIVLSLLVGFWLDRRSSAYLMASQ